MRKSAGFTLIELVIVIIILGILGAVAAPRLFNLQGDAYGANLNALRSSISTAATMANAKAQIEGVQGTEEEPTTVKGYLKNDGGLDADINFAYGYPIADATTSTANAGILGTLDGFDYNRYKLGIFGKALTITPESIDKATVKEGEDEAEVDIINENGCVVIYTPPTKNGESAKIQAFTGGC